MTITALTAAGLLLTSSDPVLVFARKVQGSGESEILTQARGGIRSLGLTLIKPESSLGAAISPDGQRAAFVCQGSLWIAPINRSRKVEAKPGAHGSWDGAQRAAVGAQGPLSWSSDSRSLLFIRPNPQRASEGSVIKLTLSPRGTSMLEAVLMPGQNQDASPSFSPDGQRILFDRGVPSGVRRLFVIGIDGRGLVEVTLPQGSWSEGSWSPDGARLVARREVAEGEEGVSGLFVAEMNGSTPAWIAGTGPEDHRPLFSPRGDEVVFARQEGRISTLYRAGAADGRKPIKAMPGNDSVHPLQWLALR